MQNTDQHLIYTHAKYMVNVFVRGLCMRVLPHIWTGLEIVSHRREKIVSLGIKYTTPRHRELWSTTKQYLSTWKHKKKSMSEL